MEKIYLFLGVIAFCYVQTVKSMTEEQLKAEFTKHVMKCVADHPVEAEELVGLQRYVLPQKSETKCLLACAYKALGTMDEHGEYNQEQSYKMAERMANGDEKRLENGKKLADICGKEANEAKVSDGEKGCEKAFILFKCAVKNATKFGFRLV